MAEWTIVLKVVGGRQRNICELCVLFIYFPFLLRWSISILFSKLWPVLKLKHVLNSFILNKKFQSSRTKHFLTQKAWLCKIYKVKVNFVSLLLFRESDHHGGLAQEPDDPISVKWEDPGQAPLPLTGLF